MKKRILSAAITLLTILVLSVYASADNYCNLGSVCAGDSVNYRVGTVSPSLPVALHQFLKKIMQVE
ncbi:MAG: hypothetical protein Q4E35_09515, partial [Eubacteriales bacterium]|nr:hypothetical protein [Eubacteriales bacterium]